jgi:hypothetical protein
MVSSASTASRIRSGLYYILTAITIASSGRLSALFAYSASPPQANGSGSHGELMRGTWVISKTR